MPAAAAAIRTDSAGKTARSPRSLLSPTLLARSHDADETGARPGRPSVATTSFSGVSAALRSMATSARLPAT